MFETWFLTVPSARTSFSAILRLLAPSASSLRISISRGLNSSCCEELDVPAVERPFRPNSIRSLLAILGWMEGSPAYTWRIVAISGLAYDLKTRLKFKDGVQSLTHKGLVLTEQDTNRVCHGFSSPQDRVCSHASLWLD